MSPLGGFSGRFYGVIQCLLWGICCRLLQLPVARAAGSWELTTSFSQPGQLPRRMKQSLHPPSAGLVSLFLTASIWLFWCFISVRELTGLLSSAVSESLICIPLVPPLETLRARISLSEQMQSGPFSTSWYEKSLSNGVVMFHFVIV